ncbi:MAG: hypothetical protein OEQ13_05910 [Acidobacteriota bacterium]|nr:hypothetical protein [Acidobacteriota bacterium]
MTNEEMRAPESATPADEPSRRSRPRVRRRRFDLRRDGLKTAVVLVAILIINFGAWAMLVRPSQQRIRLLEESRTNADLREKKAERSLTALEAVHRHVEEVREDVFRFFDDMLSTKERRSVRFQRALNDVGRDFKVAPERVSLGLTQLEKEEIEVLGFNFPLSGGYENLRQFLARLEALDQFLIVREVSLRGGREGGSSLELSINVETYFNAPQLKDEMDRKRSWRDDSRMRSSRNRGR